MKKILVFTCIIGILSVIIVSTVFAKTIYVDSTAVQGGDGKKTSPFRAINEALEHVKDGDSIRVKDGIYSENLVMMTNRIRISPWGIGRPRITVVSGERYAISIAADEVEIGGLEIRAPKGVHITGDLCMVRDIVFSGCVQPLVVKGHANVVMNNRVSGSRSEAEGRLFEVIGDHNYVGENLLIANNCPEYAGIFCQGYGAKVRNNVLYCGTTDSIRFGIVSSSITGGSYHESCHAHEISYNRIYGSLGGSFILLEGTGHESNNLNHNTLVGMGGSIATGIELVGISDEVTLTHNLISKMKAGIVFNSTVKQKNDHNNLFDNNQDVVSTGETAIRAGRNDVRKPAKFQSLSPDKVAFLWINPTDEKEVNKNDHAPEYIGARPVYPFPDERNVAFGKTLRVSGPVRLEGNELMASSNAGATAIYAVDGYRHSGKEQLWFKSGKVGWETLKTFYVVLDLGEPMPIETVRVNMASNVIRSWFLPYSIKVMVSDDDADYYLVGEINHKEEVPDGNYLLEVADLSTRGRYVLLEIHPNGTWPCMDEIEIIRGDHDPKKVKFAGENINRPGVSPLGGPGKLEFYELCKTDLKRILGYVDDIQKKKGIHTDLDRAREAIAKIRDGLKPGNNKENPEVRSGILGVCNLLAPILFEGRGGYVLSTSNPYEVLDTSKIPVENTVDCDNVVIEACRNEFESGAFLVTNSAGRDMESRVTVSSLNSLEGRVFPAKQIVLRRPVEMFYGGKYVNDALVRLNHSQGNILTVPAGQTSQVFILTNTQGVTAGTYKGTIELSCPNLATKRINLAITVHGLEVPEKSSLRTYAWSYHGGDRFQVDEIFAVRDLKAHRMNTLIEHSYVPWPDNGSFDKEGHLIKSVNYGPVEALKRRFGENLKYFDFHVFHLCFVYPEKQKLQQDDMEFGSDRWQTALREWVNDWAMNMERDYGISTGNFALYIFDEPVTDQMENLIAFVGKTLKTGDPVKYPYAHKVQIFINPMTDTMLSSAFSHLKKASPYLDIVCPQMQFFTEAYQESPEVLKELHEFGWKVWAYEGLYRDKDPYKYSRLAAWVAMQQGLDGIGFWVYAYSGTSECDMIYSVNERVPGAGDEPIIPSRRWEAWRDSVEDYALLEQLKSLAENGKEKGLSESEMKQAKDVFDGAMVNVLSNRDNPQVVLNERKEIISTIIKLSNKN